MPQKLFKRVMGIFLALALTWLFPVGGPATPAHADELASSTPTSDGGYVNTYKDASGNTTRTETYDGRNQRTSTTTNTRDAQGNTTAETKNRDGSGSTTVSDSKGRETHKA